MSMFGLDGSSWQTALRLSNIAYDFMIEKATEGTAYVNPDCDVKVSDALAADKKWGVYHFASHTDAVAEADYFINNCQGYIGKGLLILDWEGEFVADVKWAKTFLDRVFERTGVKPLIYMSEWVENAYDWSSVVKADYGLWIAKYSDYEIDHNYDMSNAGALPVAKSWPFYIMWQYTSVGRLDGYGANLDIDIFYGDGAVWDAYARPNVPNPPPVVDPAPIVIPIPVTPPPTPDPTPPSDPGTVIVPTPADNGGSTPTPPNPLPPVEPTPVKPAVKSLEGILAIVSNAVAFLTVFFSTLVLPAGSPAWLVTAIAITGAVVLNINLAIQRTKLKLQAIKSTAAVQGDK
jgi:lysozyme